MTEIYKGKVSITREELIDTFSLPSDVEFSDFKFDDFGLEFNILTTKAYRYKGRIITYSMSQLRAGGSTNIRRVRLANKYKPTPVQE